MSLFKRALDKDISILEVDDICTYRSSFNSTPLHTLCEVIKPETDKNIANILVNHRLINEPVDDRGITPLLTLAMRGFSEVLIHKECSTTFSKSGDNCLHFLSLLRNADILSHPDVDKYQNRDGFTPFYNLLLGGVEEVVKSPFITNPAPDGSMYLNKLAIMNRKCAMTHPEIGIIKDKKGSTCLHYMAASDNNDMDILNHPDINRVFDKDGFTPLGLAALSGNKHLINSDKLGAIVNINSMESAIYFLALTGEEKVLKNSEIYAFKNKDGDTPLHQLCYSDKFSITDLISHPMISKVVDSTGRTPLHVLASKAHIEVLSHPDVSKVKDSLGITPLHLLALNSVPEIKKHPDFKLVKNNAGMTPKDVYKLINTSFMFYIVSGVVLAGILGFMLYTLIDLLFTLSHK